MKNDRNPGKWVLIWEHSARAFQWIPTWQGLDGFRKSCVLVLWTKVASALEGLMVSSPNCGRQCWYLWVCMLFPHGMVILLLLQVCGDDMVSFLPKLIHIVILQLTDMRWFNWEISSNIVKIRDFLIPRGDVKTKFVRFRRKSNVPKTIRNLIQYQ